MLSRAKSKIVKSVGPRLGAAGWTPSRSTPLGDGFIDAVHGYDEEDDIKSAVTRVRSHSMCSVERLATLWQQVRYLDRFEIPGSLVECGTWRGGAVGMMALAHMRSGEPTRRVDLFDSFEGLPQPTKSDGAKARTYAHGSATGDLKAIGACEAPLDDNRWLLEEEIGYPTALLNYHVGWFQETVPSAASKIGPIALLRLDGDWYESTKVCLEYLEPLVVEAGVVVIDDYGHWPGCKRAVDEYLESLGRPTLLNHIDYTGRSWVKV